MSHALAFFSVGAAAVGASSLVVSADLPRFPPENEVRSGLSAGGRWIRTFGSRTRHQVVRPRRGRFPVIGSSPHWPGGTGISNLRPLAGWISAIERGRLQGHKQKRKLKSVAPFARNRKFESISLQQRVRNELLSTRHEPPPRISSTASHPLLESALAWAFNPEIAQERVVVRSKAARHKREQVTSRKAAHRAGA